MRTVISAEHAEQASFRSHLVQLLSNVLFLTRQTLSLWGHLEENGNYWQLLKLLGQENDELGLGLNQTRNITLHDCQNEILNQALQALHPPSRINCASSQ